MDKIKYIVIGGSAGSFQTITNILGTLPANFKFPIFLALHRLKNVRTGFVEALSIRSNLTIYEPFDKETISQGKVYLAPANYHMYIEPEKIISLSTEESVNHSRPSIDLTLSSAALSLNENLLGILLSGANKDGAEGMKAVYDEGGYTIVQDPDDCQVNTMTKAALNITPIHQVLTTNKILEFLLNLNENAK